MVNQLAVLTSSRRQGVRSGSRCLALLKYVQKHDPRDLVDNDLLVANHELLCRHHFLRPHVFVPGSVCDVGQIVSGILVLGRVADFRELERCSHSVSHVSVVGRREALVTAPRALQILNLNPIRLEVVLAARVVVILRHRLPGGFQLLRQGANVRPLFDPRRGVQDVAVQILGAVLLLVLLDSLPLDLRRRLVKQGAQQRIHGLQLEVNAQIALAGVEVHLCGDAVRAHKPRQNLVEVVHRHGQFLQHNVAVRLLHPAWYVERLHNGRLYSQRAAHLKNVGHEAVARLLGLDALRQHVLGDVVKHLVRHRQIYRGPDSGQVVLNESLPVRVVVPLLPVHVFDLENPALLVLAALRLLRHRHDVVPKEFAVDAAGAAERVLLVVSVDENKTVVERLLIGVLRFGIGGPVQANDPRRVDPVGNVVLAVVLPSRLVDASYRALALQGARPDESLPDGDRLVVKLLHLIVPDQIALSRVARDALAGRRARERLLLEMILGEQRLHGRTLERLADTVVAHKRNRRARRRVVHLVRLHLVKRGQPVGINQVALLVILPHVLGVQHLLMTRRLDHALRVQIGIFAVPIGVLRVLLLDVHARFQREAVAQKRENDVLQMVLRVTRLEHDFLENAARVLQSILGAVLLLRILVFNASHRRLLLLVTRIVRSTAQQRHFAMRALLHENLLRRRVVVVSENALRVVKRRIVAGQRHVKLCAELLEQNWNAHILLYGLVLNHERLDLLLNLCLVGSPGHVRAREMHGVRDDFGIVVQRRRVVEAQGRARHAAERAPAS